jgi:hypothetical protein
VKTGGIDEVICPEMTGTKSQQKRASRQTIDGGVLWSPSASRLGEQYKLAMRSKRQTKTTTPWQISAL